MTFSNRQQSIPEKFKAKMRVDADIRTHYKENVERIGNCIFVEDWSPHFKNERKELLDRQARLRVACENHIKEQRTNGGPENA